MKEYFGLGADSTWETLQKAVFKDTDCGAFIEHVRDGIPGQPPPREIGIAVGSIVEGSDANTITHVLKYPFTHGELAEVLDSVEDEAEELWMDANGDDTPDDHPGFDPSFLTF